MAWAVDYSNTAKAHLKKLDTRMARRVMDYMDDRVAVSDDPRRFGQALSGPLGSLWRYRIGDCRVVCDIQDEVLRVVVVRIGRRDKVYR